jgi:integrase
VSALAAFREDPAAPSGWDVVFARAPKLAATMTTYLDELSGRLAPKSVVAAELTLRQFALHVALGDPKCQSVGDVTTAHVAGWKRALEERDPACERTASKRTVFYKLATLKRCFAHLGDSGAFDVTTVVWPTPEREPRKSSTTKAASAPKPPSRALPKELEWDEIAAVAPQLAATMTAYLDQLSVSHRPTSVQATSLALRHLAAHLVATDPTCRCVAAITRAHIEDYKLALAARPGVKTPRVTSTTIRHNLGHARSFFERVIDWGWEDAPRRVPIFVGDIPKAEEPLPKFLDDPTAAKFMATLAADPDRRRRLLVELLARTGMRAGELCGIRDDAMYRVSDTWWLKIPLGKLHNDRNVPLHPLLVGLITDYRMWRGPSVNGFLLERDDGQPFDRRTVHRYVQRVAKRAGVGKVHPHQLRHTLATQCLNRGMSLEAIAALLGHRSPRMTLVYARISNENVADQYFQATHAVEADAKKLTSGARRARAQAEEHRRLLGNGQCTRPVDLDCRFQTICEGCGFFETGPQFVEILRRQRDDATAHVDRARAKLYDDLVNAIDAAPSVPGQPTPRLVG